MKIYIVATQDFNPNADFREEDFEDKYWWRRKEGALNALKCLNEACHTPENKPLKMFEIEVQENGTNDKPAAKTTGVDQGE